MEISILTEGGSSIGYGHITRCMALAERFSSIKSVKNTRLVVNADKRAEGFLKLNGAKFINLDWVNKTDKTKDLISASNITIVDSYLAPKPFYKSICAPKKYSCLAVIDDYSRLDYDADVIINPSICTARQMGYKKKRGTKYLVGRDYVILRKEFCGLPKKNINKEIKNVMVTFGGKDYPGFVTKVIGLLADKGFNLHVVSSGINKIRALNGKNVRFYPSLNSSGLLNLMLKSDLCISAGGQTTYELAAAGVPTISICFAKNQLLNLKCWEKTGFIEYAGSCDKEGIIDSLDSAVFRLLPYEERLRRSKIGRKMIDGLGAERIVEALLSDSRPEIKLRQARENDCEDIRRWRNDIRIRKWCFNKTRIDFEAHKKWFESNSGNSKVRIFIAESGGVKTGVVRFERKGSEILVSVNLNPEFLNKGLGPKIIRLGTEKVLKIFKVNLPVVAKIKNDNLASKKAFEKAGYILRKGPEENKNYAVFSYKR